MNAQAPERVTLTTDRLRLRQWQEADLEPFARLNADPIVMEFYPRPLQREESNQLAHRFQSLIAERGWGFWAVELPGKAFIGYVGLHVPASPLPFAPCVEIGWRLVRAHWGKGYATEAARAALDYGFRTLALEEIVSFTSLPNVRSQAVMQRLGMQRTGEFEHPSLPAGHILRRHCLYRVGHRDFLQHG